MSTLALAIVVVVEGGAWELLFVAFRYIDWGEGVESLKRRKAPQFTGIYRYKIYYVHASSAGQKHIRVLVSKNRKDARGPHITYLHLIRLGKKTVL